MSRFKSVLSRKKNKQSHQIFSPHILEQIDLRERSSAKRDFNQPKSIAIMGSSGSIGLNTLNIVRAYPERFKIRALAVHSSVQTVIKQAKEFRPDYVCVFDRDKALIAEKELKKINVKVVAGIEGLEQISQLKTIDEVLFAIVGAIGLLPIFKAIQAGKTVAIANKEPLVMAGELLMKAARKKKVCVLPIDSEHSGLWQCLEAARGNKVSKLILTSSGGPFRNYSRDLSKVTVKQALNHPKWKMGPKITVDSATLMNKGLEVIEAANLFEIPSKQVEVLIHPEAIIHAIVQFVDGAHLAQLGIPDMQIPIQYALSYPERLETKLPQLDFSKIGKFHFQKPDFKKFPCLSLGYEASDLGGTMPAVLNAANEVAVQAFLKQKISFVEIPKKIKRVMKKHSVIKNPGLEDLLAVDQWSREQTEALL